MARSLGEEKFASSFQFRPNVTVKDREVLRDYLYKFAHNLSEAHDYRELLANIHDLEADIESTSSLLFRISGMSLQCFALCIRKITDNSSERSIRKLINITIKPDLIAEHKNEIINIYKHYDKFLDKFVVHQDAQSVHEGISFFPDTDVIDKDLQTLREYYETLVSELCVSYIKVKEDGEYLGFELQKLLVIKDDFEEL